MTWRTLVCIALVFCASHSAVAQPQQPKHDFGWPCTGKVDPSYIRSAEATGGKVMLFKPTEVSGIADDMSAAAGHGATLVHLGSELADGVYDFDIPLDPTVESAYFFVSLQCLQSATVFQPSGDALAFDAPEVSYHAFDAIRLFTIKAPSAGTWKVRVAGRGYFSLIVKAKSELGLADVSLVEKGVPVRGLAPLGRAVRLEAFVAGLTGNVDFQFIAMSGAALQNVELTEDEHSLIPGTYAADVTLPTMEFRLRMIGMDAHGFSFQRVTERLFVGDH